MPKYLQEFWSKFKAREVAQIKEHRLRIIIAMTVSLVLASLFISFNLEDEPSASGNNNVEQPANETKEEVKSTPKIKSSQKILGLQKAAENVDLINPFKVDLKETPPAVPPVIPAPVPALPVTPIMQPPTPVAAEVEPKTILNLKGTAISGDKKLAVVAIIKSSKDNNGKSKSESQLVKIGDEVNGRKVTDIGKNFIVFDDGQKLDMSK